MATIIGKKAKGILGKKLNKNEINILNIPLKKFFLSNKNAIPLKKISSVNSRITIWSNPTFSTIMNNPRVKERTNVKKNENCLIYNFSIQPHPHLTLFYTNRYFFSIKGNWF